MKEQNMINAMSEYVLRQQLVYEAIVELRPDKFTTADKSVNDYDAALLAEKYKNVPDIGIWVKYGKWNYYMHGSGCRLTSTISGEPLEWDVPEQGSFELDWFLNWFRWLKQCNATYASIADADVHAIITQLHGEGTIIRHKIMSGYKLQLSK